MVSSLVPRHPGTRSMSSSLHRLWFPATLLVFAMHGSAAAQQAIGEVYASDASVQGSVVLAGSGTSVLSGSSIQAGAQPATLKLDRGGSLLVCEGTKLSLTASQSGRELLFSLNNGNVEMNYPLGTEADSLLTPDLRLLFPGPGTVHVAVQVTPQGDTCVQPMTGNVAAIVVAETMGDATYQVKPDEVVLFKGGHLSQAGPTKQNCGCPKPPPTQVAKAAPPPPPPVQPKPTEPVAAAPIAPTPEQHLAVEAPFVFRANDPTPDLSENVALLKVENNKALQLEPTVMPPPPVQAAKKTQSRGFFSKIGAFFGAIWHPSS